MSSTHTFSTWKEEKSCSPGTTKIFVPQVRIELTTLRILQVYRTFQPLNRRVASLILAPGMEISFVRASMVSPPSKLKMFTGNVCVLLTSVSLKLSFRSPAEKKQTETNKQTLFGNYSKCDQQRLLMLFS